MTLALPPALSHTTAVAPGWGSTTELSHLFACFLCLASFPGLFLSRLLSFPTGETVGHPPRPEQAVKPKENQGETANHRKPTSPKNAFPYLWSFSWSLLCFPLALSGGGGFDNHPRATRHLGTSSRCSESGFSSSGGAFADHRRRPPR